MPIRKGNKKADKVQTPQTESKNVKAQKEQIVAQKIWDKSLNFFSEQSYRKYIGEEIVNRGNKGSMTKYDIDHRDKIAKKVKAKVIKGPKGRMDTPKEAKHRLATHITLRGKRGKKED